MNPKINAMKCSVFGMPYVVMMCSQADETTGVGVILLTTTIAGPMENNGKESVVVVTLSVVCGDLGVVVEIT